MASLAESLFQQIAGAAPAVDQEAAIDVGRPDVQNGIAAAIPLLLTALSRNAESPDGAAALHQAIAEDHDGSVLDNLNAYLRNPDLDDGAGILKHALGDRRETAQVGISQTTGLDMNTVAKLLQFAAPLVLGMLAKQQRQRGLSADDLAGMLKEERNQESSSNPDMMAVITGMLDADKDGGVMDDLQNLAGRLFGRRGD
jgi:hypothetical protein